MLYKDMQTHCMCSHFKECTDSSISAVLSSSDCGCALSSVLEGVPDAAAPAWQGYVTFRADTMRAPKQQVRALYHQRHFMHRGIANHLRSLMHVQI